MLAEQLLRASIEGGVLFLVLLIGLKLVPSIPPLVRVWLWRIAFIKLALSLLPLARIPLNILPPVELPQVTASYVDISASAQPSTPTNAQWLYAWAAGVSVSGIFLLRRILIAKEVVSDAKPTTDEALVDSVTELAKRAGLKQMPNLLLNDARSSAVVVGGFKRSIVLPNDQLEQEDKRLILAHEIAHIAHRDLEWNALFSIVQVVFFFHPLVWLGLRSVQNAQEAAADALAVNLTKTSPKRYGEMLVRATVLNSSPFPSLAAGLWLGASTGNIRVRINDLRFVNTRPTAGRFASMITLICLVVAITPAYQLGARQYPAAAPVVAPVALQAVHSRAAIMRKHVRPTRPRKARHWKWSRATAPRVMVSSAPMTPVTATAPASVSTRIAPQAITVPTPASAPTIAPARVSVAMAPAAVSVRLEPVRATTAVTLPPVAVRTLTPSAGTISISAPAAATAPTLTPTAATAPQARRAKPAKRTRGAHGGTARSVGYNVSGRTYTASSNGVSSGGVAITTVDTQGLGSARASGSSNGDTTTIVSSSTANAQGGQSVNTGVSVTNNKSGTVSYTVTAQGQRTNIHQGKGIGKGVGHGISTASSSGVQARGGN